MKNLVLFSLLVLGIGSAKAENWYVGGSLGLYDTNVTGENSMTFQFAPELGYWFADNMAVGVTLDMDFHKDFSGLSISPYLRYSFYSIGKLSCFVDGIGTIPAGDYKNWKIGVQPGIAFNINDKFAVVSHLGFLGYRQFNNRNIEGDKVYQAGLWVSNDLSFSFYYNF